MLNQLYLKGSSAKSILKFFAFLFLFLLTGCQSTLYGNGSLAWPAQPKQIALLLPLNGPYGQAGRAVRDGFMTAYFDSLQQGNTNTAVKVYDTTQNNITTLYRKAVDEGADLVVGPLDKEDVQRLSTSYLSVPVIALNYTSNSPRSSGMYEFGLSPQNEATSSAERAFQAGHRNAILIYPRNAWGQGIADAFYNRWHQLNGTVVASLSYSSNQNLRDTIHSLLQVNDKAIRDLQKKHDPKQPINFSLLRRTDFDMIFLVATPSKAREISPLLRFYYANDIPIYSISTIYSGIPNQNFYRDVEGVYFCDMPWVLTSNTEFQRLQNTIIKNWPNAYQNSIRLYAVGIDAYYLTKQLPRLSLNPGTSYSGATGDLSLNGQIILQRLPCAQFRNGLATIIS